MESALGADDPLFPRYAASLTGGTLTAGDEYEILANGVEIFPPMLEAIRGARRRISFETYIFDEGAVAGEFSQALAAAARRGVRVRVIVDAVGAQTMEAAHRRMMGEAGVELAVFNPLHWYSLEEVNYRTHRKILVVDGEVGFTGGVGVADHWLGNAESRDRWRDSHVRVVGPAVTHLEAAFYENWAETGHVSSAELDLQPEPALTRARSIVAWSSPTGGSNAVKLLYLVSIAAARRTLDICSPYLVLDESTRYALLQARRRGVRVRLLVEGELTDALAVKYASRNDYDELLSAGVQVFEYQPTMMHVKATIVDGIWSIIGSTNFDNRSFELNDEINVAVASSDVAGRLTEDFEADLGRALQLDIDDWRERPFTQKMREGFWALFGELF